MAKKGNKNAFSKRGRGRPKKVIETPKNDIRGRGRPRKEQPIVVVSAKAQKKPEVTLPKKVEQGKMSIDTEQMLKDLIELGRIKPEDDKNKNNVKDSWELPKSPLSKFIDKKNSFYIKAASIFTIIVIIFFVSVLYVTNSKAIINIGLKNIDTNGEIKKTINIFTQQDSPENNNIIALSINAKANLEDTYNDIEATSVGEAKAVGKIKIYNNTSAPRQLLATTRFISDKTQNLYRLKTGVTVPANSSLDAEIYADNNTILGEDIGVRFTIPGLREELRSQVYGESSEVISVKTITKKVVKDEDIKKANDLLDIKLRQAVINKLKEQMKDKPVYQLVADSFDYKISDRKVNAKVGDEVDALKVSGTIDATAVFVDRSKILELAKSNILSRSLSGSSITVKEDSLDYKVDSLDLIKKQMVLRILVDFTSNYDINNLLNKNTIAGMDIDDFYSYVAQRNFATKVNVVSYPFWNTKLPNITDNIIINVK